MAETSEADRSGTVFAILWRHVVLIGSMAVAGLVLGLLVSYVQPTSYTAESRVFLSSQASFDAIDNGQNASDPSRYLDQQAALMTSTPLLARAIALGAQAADTDDLKQSVDVIASAESDLLTVQGSASDSVEAAGRVDALIAAYREYQSRLVATQLTAIEQVSNGDERRLARQRAAVYGDGVELVEKASVTQASSAIRNASVLAVVGLLLGAGLAFVLNARGNSGRAQPRRRGQATTAGHAPGWGDLPAGEGVDRGAPSDPHLAGRAPRATGPDGAPIGASSSRGRQ